jgi:hypothetical protein
MPRQSRRPVCRREEAKHCDRNFLKEQCEQSPDQAKDERDD